MDFFQLKMFDVNLTQKKVKIYVVQKKAKLIQKIKPCI